MRTPPPADVQTNRDNHTSPTGLMHWLRSFRDRIPLPVRAPTLSNDMAASPEDCNPDRSVLITATAWCDLEEMSLADAVAALSEACTEAVRFDEGLLACLTYDERDRLAAILANAANAPRDRRRLNRRQLVQALTARQPAAPDETPAPRRPRREFHGNVQLSARRLHELFEGLLLMEPLLESLNLSELPVEKALANAAEALFARGEHRPMLWLELDEPRRRDLIGALRFARETVQSCRLGGLAWPELLEFMARQLFEAKAYHVKRAALPLRPSRIIAKDDHTQRRLRRAVPVLYCLGRQLNLIDLPLPLALHRLEQALLDHDPGCAMLYDDEQLQLAAATAALFYRAEMARHIQAECRWPDDLAALFAWIKLMTTAIPHRRLKRALLQPR